MAAVAEKIDEASPKIDPANLRIRVADLKDEGHARRRFFVRAPERTTNESPLYPGFFANVTKMLSRHDLITIMADDESWEMEVVVEAVILGGAEVSVRKVYSRKAIRQAMTTLSDTDHTEWRSGRGWCVIRRMPGRPEQAIIEGHGTEVGAKLEWTRSQPAPVL